MQQTSMRSLPGDTPDHMGAIIGHEQGSIPRYRDTDRPPVHLFLPGRRNKTCKKWCRRCRWLPSAERYKDDGVAGPPTPVPRSMLCNKSSVAVVCRELRSLVEDEL